MSHEVKKMKNKVTNCTAGWSWQRYLEECKAESAPADLFTKEQCSTNQTHGFKVGMKLEGVDPLHPSIFCVLSVAEVIGCRLRLHIDGYSECYDFWVNADSPDIRPAGWCLRQNHKLHPPKGYHETGFDWQVYLRSTNSKLAPEDLFTIPSPPPSSLFRGGLKLEAVDRKNPSLVCVATVADVIDQQRILVHFDNWDDSYDYWCDSSSPYIHPIGWCREQARPLTAPQGHPCPESFQWEDYLEQTKSSAAPSSAFTPRAPHGFQVGHKLEAVDGRNPMLIRVATVTETDAHRVKIHYSGWSDQFDVWCDSDLCDLHPAGWCQQTGHPLETPADSSLRPAPSQGVCPTPGCRGVGHIKGPKYNGHHSAFGCPYSDMNVRRETIFPDRLAVGGRGLTATPGNTASHHHHGNQKEGWRVLRPRGRPPGRTSSSRGFQVKTEPGEEQPCGGTARLVLALRKRSTGLSRSSEPTKFLRVKKEEEEIQLTSSTPSSTPEATSLQALHQSVFLSSKELPVHCKLLPGAAGLNAHTVQTWSVTQVSEFIESLLGCEDLAKRFRDQQIDGRALLLLTQRDILSIMSIKLGPALKIYTSILMFKHADNKDQSVCQDKDA
ncbi:lethal(3)malignant brain tumor-like protein 4 isoform X1 [Gadus morhua]|uniref:lethal(3)malignant brain tumor-like protein 4 isoform X1 n=2 Tax=Gadus morhua TaxID=8049 RepID=UPI0011B6A173|nr:lethal(3)malignant brain tumor-like protein 4 isoform X1 [Gadus morhua]XP_030205243.1 lethal(3)malignant brain tumor-like protein 4 isoform X1 [Gadus morhua]